MKKFKNVALLLLSCFLLMSEITVGGGRGGSGALLVGSVVLTEATNTMTVSGLDSDTDLVYFGVAAMNFTGTPATSAVFVTFNGGTTRDETGYVKENTNGAVTTTTSDNNTLLNSSLSTGSIRALQFNIVNARNSANDDNYPNFHYSCFACNVGASGVISKSVGDNTLSSISLITSAMDFGAGSYLKIYKYGS